MSKSLDICISLYGIEKISLLYALLASIIHLYGDHNYENEGIRINLLVQDIPDVLLEEIKRKVKLDLRIIKDTEPIGRDQISGKMRLWQILVDNADKDNILLLDADTVLVRDISSFFDKKFDVGFTYKTDKDENLAWPINTGVILLRNNEPSRWFFKNWVKLTRDYVLDCKNETKRLEGWGALDQAAFGHQVGTRSVDTFRNGIRLGPCFIQGFPCSILNETRCKSMENCHIIHYKGFAQKMVLSGEYNQWRPENKCRCMKEYWDSLREYWSIL
jgi:hypothetical protein